MIGSGHRLKGGLSRLVLLCVLSLACNAYGDTLNFQVNRLGVAEGLSQSFVFAVTQDHQGYMWFGTQEGLNRYDGQRITRFYHEEKDPESLGADWIWDLLVDRNGLLYVATQGGGLNIYDPYRETFTRYLADPNHAASIPSDAVRSLYEDSSEAIWIGLVGAGLSRFDPASGVFSRSDQHEFVPAVENLTITAIQEDSDNTLWVGTNENGVFRYDVGKHQFVQDQTLAGKVVRSIYLDPKGELWVATLDHGVSRRNTQHDKFENLELNIDGIETGIYSARDMLVDRSGTFWIASESSGLIELSVDGKTSVYSNDVSDPKSINSDQLNKLYEDRTGLLWIATYGGVNAWNASSDAFRYLDWRSVDFDSNLISALEIDPGGHRWIGLYGSGLLAMDQNDAVVYKFEKSADHGHALSDDRIMSLAFEQDGTVWVGTRFGGLNQVSLLDGTVKHHRADPDDPTKLATDAITALLVDRDGTLWVGVYGGGLHRYRDGQFERFQHDANDITTVSSNVVVSLLQDQTGRLWVGTEDGGLNLFDYGRQDFTRFAPDLAERAFPSASAWDLFQSRDGSLWIATSAKGLIQWQAPDLAAIKPEFIVYGKENGLVSNTVQGIVEDDAGRIWLSTNRGLTAFDRQRHEFKHFDHRNGLRGIEFNQGLAVKHNGKLLFGGADGVTILDPTRLRRNTMPPSVALHVKSSGKTLHRAYNIDPQVGQVTLSYPDHSVDFEFAALDFISPDKNTYRVRLHGFDNEWYDPGEYPRVNYTNLASGRYRFEVEAGNNDGQWSEQGAAVELVVTAPPWKTDLAYTLYTLAGFLLVFIVGVAARKRKVAENQRKAELEAQVAMRTQELAEQNNELESLNLKLRDASLTDPLTELRNRRYFYEVIEGQIAQIDRRYADEDKPCQASQFFMMIDLDGFKSINDTFGHLAGDRALIQLAELLTTVCRDSDIVCRWGGDEFFVSGQLEHRNKADSLAERICTAIREESFELGNGQEGRLTASIGLTHYPISYRHPDSASWEQVSDLADRAAGLAKTNGKDRWVRITAQTKVDLSVLPSEQADLLVMAEQQKLDIDIR